MWKSRIQNFDAEPIELKELGTDTRLRLLSTAASFEGSLALLGKNLVHEVCLGAWSMAGARPMQLTCRGQDHHSLVLSWVETLLYMMEERQVALSNIDVQVSRSLSLRAQCLTRSTDHARCAMPKGLDPTSARATQSEDGRWQAECTLLMAVGSAPGPWERRHLERHLTDQDPFEERRKDDDVGGEGG